LNGKQHWHLRQAQAVIGEHDNVTVHSVFEVIVDAFFLAKPVQQRQIAFFVLDAKRPDRVLPDAHFNPVALNGQGIFREQLLENLRHAPLHEHPPFARLGQPLQARHQVSR
jgi:hypothetical protein